MKSKFKKRPCLVRQLALGANAEEVRKFDLIKVFHCRISDSDMIRFLINQEAEKILPKNTPIGVLKQKNGDYANQRKIEE